LRRWEVSRSGYYEFKTKSKSQNRLNTEKLLIEIKRVFWGNNRNYGSLRVWNELRNKEQIPCFVNRVAYLMRANGIFAIQKRKFRVTTNSKHNYPLRSNLLSHNFIVAQSNNVWVSDIAYFWTFESWLYLAVILDLFSRGIVGCAMDKNMPIL